MAIIGKRSPYDGSLVRHAGDTRRDVVVKRELFENEIRHRWRVIAVFDDRNLTPDLGGLLSP